MTSMKDHSDGEWFGLRPCQYWQVSGVTCAWADLWYVDMCEACRRNTMDQDLCDCVAGNGNDVGHLRECKGWRR